MGDREFLSVTDSVWDTQTVHGYPCDIPLNIAREIVWQALNPYTTSRCIERELIFMKLSRAGCNSVLGKDDCPLHSQEGLAPLLEDIVIDLKPDDQ